MEPKILKATAQPGAIIRQEVMDAATESRRMLEAAAGEAERLRREAREEGFREGFSQWESAIREAQQAATRYAVQHQEDFLRLSVRIAEKVLGETLRAEPERLMGLVQEALRNLSRERRLTIEVAPGQSSVLERNRSMLESRVGPDCTLRIVESAEVSAGGCLLRSELGTIDARIETQLHLIEKALLEEWSRAAEAVAPEAGG